jgi:hemin uptake protein HemP
MPALYTRPGPGLGHSSSFCSEVRAVVSGSAACANAADENITANENTDAPKIKARECLAPKAICPNPFFKSLSLAGGRRFNLRGCLLATTCRDRVTPLVSRPYWLRRGAGTVNAARPLFISIVNCGGWIARRSNYTRIWSREPFGGLKDEMATTSGDQIGGPAKSADSASPATRSVILHGNRIESRDLFAVEREIIIAHGEDSYRLRLTSQNKLILTK